MQATTAKSARFFCAALCRASFSAPRRREAHTLFKSIICLKKEKAGNTLNPAAF